MAHSILKSMFFVKFINRRPILKSMSVYHFLKSMSNDATSVCFKWSHIRCLTQRWKSDVTRFQMRDFGWQKRRKTRVSRNPNAGIFWADMLYIFMTQTWDACSEKPLITMSITGNLFLKIKWIRENHKKDHRKTESIYETLWMSVFLVVWEMTFCKNETRVNLYLEF